MTPPQWRLQGDEKWNKGWQNPNCFGIPAFVCSLSFLSLSFSSLDFFLTLSFSPLFLAGLPFSKALTGPITSQRKEGNFSGFYHAVQEDFWRASWNLCGCLRKWSLSGECRRVRGWGWGWGEMGIWKSSRTRGKLYKNKKFFYILGNNTKQVAWGQDMLHYTASFLYSVYREANELRIGRTWHYEFLIVVQTARSRKISLHDFGYIGHHEKNI